MPLDASCRGGDMRFQEYDIITQDISSLNKQDGWYQSTTLLQSQLLDGCVSDFAQSAMDPRIAIHFDEQVTH